MVATITPDNFTPTVVTKTDDYLYAEFQVGGWGCVRMCVCCWFVCVAAGSVDCGRRLATVLMLRPCPCAPAPLQSPTFGFIDDVEFFFPPDKPGIVEYR